jgi:hypothetical protein
MVITMNRINKEEAKKRFILCLTNESAMC